MKAIMFKEIPTSTTWKTVTKIAKGWSPDEKYLIETISGQKLLLRVSDSSLKAEKIREFEIMQKFSRLGFAMSFPLEYGVCSGGQNVYLLLTWVEGEDLESCLPVLPESAQYRLGEKAGRILRKIHGIQVPQNELPQETKLPKKLRQLDRYLHSGLRVENDEAAVDFIRENIHLIWNQPPVYLHGDFHPGNLILTGEEEIGVIDFNRWEIGDPYEEFYKLESFGVEASIPYCIGEINAYFDHAVPDQFWKTLAVYVAHASLFSIKWAEKFGQAEIENMVIRCKRAFEDYDNFNRTIPKWFKEINLTNP
jgi:aminoglycoside phosphotransferase (APT) family kinase protein